MGRKKGNDCRDDFAPMSSKGNISRGGLVLNIPLQPWQNYMFREAHKFYLAGTEEGEIVRGTVGFLVDSIEPSLSGSGSIHQSKGSEDSSGLAHRVGTSASFEDQVGPSKRLDLDIDPFSKPDPSGGLGPSKMVKTLGSWIQEELVPRVGNFHSQDSLCPETRKADVVVSDWNQSLAGNLTVKSNVSTRILPLVMG